MSIQFELYFSCYSSRQLMGDLLTSMHSKFLSSRSVSVRPMQNLPSKGWIRIILLIAAFLDIYLPVELIVLLIC